MKKSITLPPISFLLSGEDHSAYTDRRRPIQKHNNEHDYFFQDDKNTRLLFTPPLYHTQPFCPLLSPLPSTFSPHIIKKDRPCGHARLPPLRFETPEILCTDKPSPLQIIHTDGSMLKKRRRKRVSMDTKKDSRWKFLTPTVLAIKPAASSDRRSSGSMATFSSITLESESIASWGGKVMENGFGSSCFSWK